MFQVRVTGIEELKKNCKYARELAAKGDFIEELARRIVKLTKQNAPRKTGRLVRSVDYEKTGKNTFKIVVTAVNGRDEPYPIYLEFGTRYIRVGTAANPRVYKSSSGKMAQLPYVRSSIYQLTTKREIEAVVKQLIDIFDSTTMISLK